MNLRIVVYLLQTEAVLELAETVKRVVLLSGTPSLSKYAKLTLLHHSFPFNYFYKFLASYSMEVIVMPTDLWFFESLKCRIESSLKCGNFWSEGCFAHNSFHIW